MNPVTLARRPIALVCLAVAALALTGCGTAPVHPTLQAAQASGQLPPLVPMRRFVANVDAHGGVTLSPDGQQLLWSRVVGTEAGLAARGVDEPEATARPIATGHLARRDIGGGTYGWLPDSRHAYYVRDPRGDEATQIHVVDTRTRGAKPWLATPWPGARSTVVARGEPGSARFFFTSNRRDKATFDLYEADATARSVREVADVIRRIENATGEEAKPADIARALQIPLDEYYRIMQDAVSCRLFSFDQMGTGEEDGNPAAFTADEGPGPAEQLEEDDFRKALAAAIDALPEREKLVLSLYYDDELNLREIGAILDVSESRICQIHGQALVRLRARIQQWMAGR